MSANTEQVGGTHYCSPYQPWDFAMDLFAGCFFLGNANKYITRWRKKNGVEDLRKALHYLEKRLELEDQGRAHMLAILSQEARAALLARYVEANELQFPEEEVLDHMAAGDLEQAAHGLALLIAEEDLRFKSARPR